MVKPQTFPIYNTLQTFAIYATQQTFYLTLNDIIIVLQRFMLSARCSRMSKKLTGKNSFF